MKKVYCLYRVSSAAQVEKDDIPMQKQSCREFAERQGWEVVNEFAEKGVSGFKVSAKNRDAIQDIQRAAVEKQFDILLVFMFDRIGRIDSETPFVVEWFINNGIEVWSVNEGQQRLDSHTDKLLNYIRYWQASGESIKTSVRTKTRKAQLAQQGIFYGGAVPFGYRLVKKGRTNKKGHEIHDIEINPDEAEYVKLIFEKYVHEGLGVVRLCLYLDDNGIRNSKGNKLTYNSVRCILRCPMYSGIMTCGDVRSDVIPELKILDDDLFQQAQKLREERAKKADGDGKPTIPINTRGKSLLSGNIFCASCGSRLQLSWYGHTYIRKSDGAKIENRRVRYICVNRNRKLRDCEGQTCYIMHRVDGMVTELLMGLFQNIRGVAENDLIEKSYQRELASSKTKLKGAQSELRKHTESIPKALKPCRAKL